MSNSVEDIFTGNQDKTDYFFYFFCSVNNMAESSHAKAGLNVLFVT